MGISFFPASRAGIRARLPVIVVISEAILRSIRWWLRTRRMEAIKQVETMIGASQADRNTDPMEPRSGEILPGQGDLRARPVHVPRVTSSR